jgi:hypothetical protein
MCSVLDAPTGLDGSITRRQIALRNTKKVRKASLSMGSWTDLALPGKYLLERERLVKDNAWKLDETEEY